MAEETTTDPTDPQATDEVAVDAPAQETPEAPATPKQEQAAEAAPDLAQALEAANARIAELTERIEREDMTKAVREAVAQVTGLSAPSKARVAEALSAGPILKDEALTARIAEAVETERAHEQALAQSMGLRPRVRIGPSATPAATPETKSAEVREAERADWAQKAQERGLDRATAERLAKAR